jgi:lipoprotein NlpD
VRRAGAAIALGVLLLSACHAPHRPPVVERSPAGDRSSATHYTVRGGDTLYSIAWRHGLDYRDLARINGIAPPYRIHPNQRLTLRAPAGATAARSAVPAPAPPPAPAADRTTATAPSRTPQPAARPQIPPPAAAASGWQWPARGRLVRDYGGSHRSIDLELAPGTRISAVADGEVVYAGVGLRGFRHLVIIKHDSAHLSAYSLNQPVRVREGERVRAGTTLAEAAGRGADALLRFEIRRDGVPVDPRGLIGRS